MLNADCCCCFSFKLMQIMHRHSWWYEYVSRAWPTNSTVSPFVAWTMEHLIELNNWMQNGIMDSPFKVIWSNIDEIRTPRLPPTINLPACLPADLLPSQCPAWRGQRPICPLSIQRFSSPGTDCDDYSGPRAIYLNVSQRHEWTANQPITLCTSR